MSATEHLHVNANVFVLALALDLAFVSMNYLVVVRWWCCCCLWPQFTHITKVMLFMNMHKNPSISFVDL